MAWVFFLMERFLPAGSVGRNRGEYEKYAEKAGHLETGTSPRQKPAYKTVQCGVPFAKMQEQQQIQDTSKRNRIKKCNHVIKTNIFYP